MGVLQDMEIEAMRLKDKVAVVTGAASGIGKEIARTFARAGAKIAIADLDVAGAELAAAELKRDGAQAIALAVDVTDETQTNAAMASVVAAFGQIDVLVSNAGIQIIAPLEDFSFADWKRVLAVHLDGAFLSTRAALRQMYKQGSGSIIYIGSVHSKEASLLKAPYVTAKHGLMGLAKVVAKEGAKHGVRANVICPGFCAYAAGRQTDPGAGADARDIRGGSHSGGHAQGNRRWRIHNGSGRRRSRPFLRVVRVECDDGSIAGRQPWLVHAVTEGLASVVALNAGTGHTQPPINVITRELQHASTRRFGICEFAYCRCR
jgi:3-hydroxybutyrate dehydrogenase